jgi:hypothetical protein
LKTLRAMSTWRLTLFALAACAASSFGGEIYGTIKENGKPVEKGLSITITPIDDKSPKPTDAEKCPKQTDGKQTDEFGSYRIFVPEVGPCTLCLTLKTNTKDTVSCKIQSYSKPTRFDLVLEKTNGKYTLKRK